MNAPTIGCLCAQCRSLRLARARAGAEVLDKTLQLAGVLAELRGSSNTELVDLRGAQRLMAQEGRA